MPKPLVGKRQRGHNVRYKKSLEPVLFETVKPALLLKGNKSSEVVQQVLRDMHAIKNPNSKLFSRRNDVLPFENESSIEFMCQKNDAGLFLYASHNKKRPNNLVFGRLFDGHVLDMIEVGVDKFESMEDIHKRTGMSKVIGSSPCIVFQGDAFTQSNVMIKLKNLLLDFFKGRQLPQVDLASLDHVIVVTVDPDQKVYIRNYGVGFVKNTAKMNNDTPQISLVDMGPSLDLTVRRNKFAASSIQKVAYKVPKAAKGAKKQKNVTRNSLEGKVGRIHMKRQDMEQLVQRSRFKALKKRGRGDSQAGANKKTRQ